MYHFISAFQSSVYFLSLPLPWFFSLEISSFFFPRALKSLPESEPWLLFIFIFNIKCADILQALFWLISSVVGKNGTLSIEVKSLFLKHCILYQLFGVTVPFFFFLLIIAFVFYNERRKILEWGRKVSQTLFFLFSDIMSKECYFKSLYTFFEHPGTHTNKES